MVCGRTTVIEVDGLLRYMVDVRAVGQAGKAACGEAGRPITFAVDGQALLPTATWDNAQMWALDLSSAP